MKEFKLGAGYDYGKRITKSLKEKFQIKMLRDIWGIKIAAQKRNLSAVDSAITELGCCGGGHGRRWIELESR